MVTNNSKSDLPLAGAGLRPKVGIARRPLEGQRLFVLIYSLNYLWRHFYGVGTRRLTGWHSSFADCFSSSCTYVDVRLDIRGVVQNLRAKSFQNAVHFKFDFRNKDRFYFNLK